MPHFPWDLGLALIRDVPRGRRSLVRDSAEMASRISPAPVIKGMEKIPRSGSIVVAANHYQRRGLWIGWPGAVITSAVAACRQDEKPVNWIVTGGLRLWQSKQSGPELPLSGYFFGRMARTYGITALPLNGPGRRATALRSWLRGLDTGEALGLFPEGLAGRSGELRHPEPGFERLSRLLARRGAAILPVAVFEENGRLHVHFGSVVPAGSSDDTMEAIAALLPPSQRGPFGRAHGTLD